jgi:hypothetical protein
VVTHIATSFPFVCSALSVPCNNFDELHPPLNFPPPQCQMLDMSQSGQLGRSTHPKQRSTEMSSSSIGLALASATAATPRFTVAGAASGPFRAPGSTVAAATATRHSTTIIITAVVRATTTTVITAVVRATTRVRLAPIVRFDTR